MNAFSRFFAVGVAAAGLSSIVTAIAVAQDFPSKEVTIVAPYPPGAVTDGIARILQQGLTEKLGRPIIIENHPGAGGTVGVGHTVRSTADGYTTVMGVNAPFVMAPAMQANIPYNTVADLKGIGRIGETYLTLVVRKESEIDSIEDLVRIAKERPGELTFGSAGIGSAHHIAGELLSRGAGIELVHVPFQGGAPAIQNLVGDQLDMSFGTLPAVFNFVQSGELKIIAFAEPKRVASHPDVPLISDTVPGVETTTWLGFFAPSGTPDDVIAKLNEALTFAISKPEVQEQMIRLGIVPNPSTAAELDALVAADLKFWANAMDIAGIEKQ